MSQKTLNMRGDDEIFLVFGEEHGKDAWYFVSISKLKKPIFNKMVEACHYNLPSVGRVLESGWGKEPPESSRKKWLNS